jgi:hypothetical protein
VTLNILSGLPGLALHPNSTDSGWKRPGRQRPPSQSQSLGTSLQSCSCWDLEVALMACIISCLSSSRTFKFLSLSLHRRQSRSLKHVVYRYRKSRKLVLQCISIGGTWKCSMKRPNMSSELSRIRNQISVGVTIWAFVDHFENAGEIHARIVIN